MKAYQISIKKREKKIFQCGDKKVIMPRVKDWHGKYEYW